MDVKDNFKSLCDKVFSGKTLIISRPKNENIVMISEHVYNEMLIIFLCLINLWKKLKQVILLQKPLQNWRNMKNNRGALKDAPNHCQSKEKLFLDHATYHFSNLIIHSEPGSPVNLSYS